MTEQKKEKKQKKVPKSKKSNAPELATERIDSNIRINTNVKIISGFYNGNIGKVIARDYLPMGFAFVIVYRILLETMDIVQVEAQEMQPILFDDDSKDGKSR